MIFSTMVNITFSYHGNHGYQELKGVKGEGWEKARRGEGELTEKC